MSRFTFRLLLSANVSVASGVAQTLSVTVRDSHGGSVPDSKVTFRRAHTESGPEIAHCFFENTLAARLARNALSYGRGKVSADRIARDWTGRLVVGEYPDRQFDIEFWQKQGDEAIFSAAWEIIELAEEMKHGRKPELQRTVTALKRLPR